MTVASKLSRRRKVRGRRRAQRGLAAIEVVVTTGIVFPALAFFLYYGIQVCRNYFSVAGSMIGSPF
ncbi:hypothetical protein OAS39_10250 [Pirellulales bacterium]|nr:hypothetical protein [Pirellulales bacterium]